MASLPKSTYNRAVFFKFIEPCHPQRAKTVPTSDDWQHEVKFDGFRVQIHKLDNDFELYSRNGSLFGTLPPPRKRLVRPRCNSRYAVGLIVG